MPQEKKKRGRRAEEARHKAQKDRSKQFTPLEFYDAPDQATGEVGYGGAPESGEGLPFFGLLDDQEHEYFRLQTEILDANTFESDEDRTAFVNSFFREASGKLLKLANSQGCSRLLERMMALASPEQLKMTFQMCNGNFLHLVQHRFASHFCESLFVHSAAVVSQEEEEGVLGVMDTTDMHGEVFASMESLFLYTLNELEPALHSLLTHSFASHTIRVLLLVLSGQGANTTASSNLIQSRKKENSLEAGKLAENRKVPNSFKEATTRILTNMCEKLNMRELRILAFHPVGSPALQFFLRLELVGASGKKGRKRSKCEPQNQKTLLKMLLNGEESDEDNSASSFLQSLFYDSVGSHLLETIIISSNQQTFDELYETYFKERVVSLARNEQASHVAVRIVGRLVGNQLMEFIEALIPSVSQLLERSLTNVLKAIIDRTIQQNLDASKVVKAIADTYHTSDTASVVFKMLKISEQELFLHTPAPENVTSAGSCRKEKQNPAQLHGSLLAQSILQLPGDSSLFIYESLLAQTPTSMVSLSSHPITSHLVQASLTSPHASIINKRKIFNLLAGHFAQLAISPSGSHLVDACWNAAQGMNNYWQGIAQELAAGETDVRASPFGRIVWRNWAMDKFKTRRGDWVKLGKCDKSAWECNPRFTSTAPESPLALANGSVKKSAIQLARERRAAQRKQKEKFLARVTYQGDAVNSSNSSHEGGLATAKKRGRKM